MDSWLPIPDSFLGAGLPPAASHPDLLSRCGTSSGRFRFPTSDFRLYLGFSFIDQLPKCQFHLPVFTFPNRPAAVPGLLEETGSFSEGYGQGRLLHFLGPDPLTLLIQTLP